MTILRIDCDASWLPVSCGGALGTGGRLPDGELIPVTPRAALWQAPTRQPGEPNALASALLSFLQLPIRQLQGPAYLTGLDGTRLTCLSPIQQQAFTSTLRALVAMPDYLALHAQAGRIAAAWFCPTTDGSLP